MLSENAQFRRESARADCLKSEFQSFLRPAKRSGTSRPPRVAPHRDVHPPDDSYTPPDSGVRRASGRRATRRIRERKTKRIEQLVFLRSFLFFIPICTAKAVIENPCFLSLPFFAKRRKAREIAEERRRDAVSVSPGLILLPPPPPSLRAAEGRGAPRDVRTLPRAPLSQLSSPPPSSPLRLLHGRNAGPARREGGRGPRARVGRAARAAAR